MELELLGVWKPYHMLLSLKLNGEVHAECLCSKQSFEGSFEFVEEKRFITHKWLQITFSKDVECVHNLKLYVPKDFTFKTSTAMHVKIQNMRYTEQLEALLWRRD